MHVKNQQVTNVIIINQCLCYKIKYQLSIYLIFNNYDSFMCTGTTLSIAIGTNNV